MVTTAMRLVSSHKTEKKNPYLETLYFVINSYQSRLFNSQIIRRYTIKRLCILTYVCKAKFKYILPELKLRCPSPYAGKW